MDEILEEEKKPSQPKRTALFVASTIAIFVIVLLSLLVWSINFKEIVDSANEEGGVGDALAAIFAIILLALPFLGASALIVIISAVFAPLTLVKLRKSSSKAFSTVGLVYGIAFIVAFIATVVRVVLFFLVIQ
jgi:hypothetical protein